MGRARRQLRLGGPSSGKRSAGGGLATGREGRSALPASPPHLAEGRRSRKVEGGACQHGCIAQRWQQPAQHAARRRRQQGESGVPPGCIVAGGYSCGCKQQERQAAGTAGPLCIAPRRGQTAVPQRAQQQGAPSKEGQVEQAAGGSLRRLLCQPAAQVCRQRNEEQHRNCQACQLPAGTQQAGVSCCFICCRLQGRACRLRNWLRCQRGTAVAFPCCGRRFNRRSACCPIYPAA